MAAALQKNGYRVTVVVPKIYKASRTVEDQEGIKVYRFPFFAGGKLLIEHKGIPYLRMVAYYVSGFFTSIYALLRSRSRLIHVHWAIPTGLIGVLVGMLLRKPVVVTIHGSDFRMATERYGMVTKIFLYVCKRARKIICVSELQRKRIQEMGVRTGEVLTSPMGIDESFLEVGRRRRERLHAQSHTILSNRNLLPLYNVSLLIRAIPIILKEEPETRFLIAGDGPERETLERQTKNLNVQSSVEFLGRVSHEEIPDLLAKADIYVSTSLHDGTSVSLLEAMGAGAFPVVTDIPANREWIVDGENGFLVNQSEEEFLSKRIIDAIRNHELLGMSRVRNRLIIEKAALWPEYVNRIEAVYGSILRS